MMTNFLGWIISDFFNLIQILLIVIVAVGLLIVALKYEGSRKFVYFGICFIVCLSGAFAGIDIYKKMTSESYTYGTVIYKEIQLDSILDFDLDGLTLYEDEDGSYFYEETIGAIEFNGLKENYNIYVNGIPLSKTKLDAGYISAEYKDFYYDVSNNIVASVTLTIKFEFLSSETRFSIRTEISSNAESYLQQYIQDKGFKIQVIKEDK